MLPSALRLMRKTHLELITFLPGGHGTLDHVCTCSRVAISLSMASRHCGQSGRDMASLSVVGLPCASVAKMATRSSESRSERSTLSGCKMYSPVVMCRFISEGCWHRTEQHCVSCT